MSERAAVSNSRATDGVPRSAAVLEAALGRFAQFGYRKTSMDDVARAAGISRPGLYFLFNSKEELFRAAVSQAVNADVDAVAGILDAPDRPLRRRLLDSFDRWAGRYVGPAALDLAAVIDDNPGLLGSLVVSAPKRFAELITHAIAAEFTDRDQAFARDVSRTLISTSIGIKYQVKTRSAYRKRLDVAIGLVLR